MTRTFAGLALAFATSISIPAVNQAHEPPKTPPEKMEVRARYLGVTGWEFTDGKTQHSYRSLPLSPARPPCGWRHGRSRMARQVETG